MPLYTVFLRIYQPILSFSSLFLLLPSPQFIKQIPDFIVAADICRGGGGFQVTLHFISYLFFHFVESFYLFFLLVLSWQLHSFYTPNLLFFLKRGRGIPQSDKVPEIPISMAAFQIPLPSVRPSFPVVSAMQLDYKWMNIFRLRFHEPLY